MREYTEFMEQWRFVKKDIGAGAAASEVIDAAFGEMVDLPHTWNAVDGQDGGNDYYRGKCWYVKRLPQMKLERDEQLWLEFRGVAMMAEVYVNGQLAGSHDGGYSTFRVNLTPWLGFHVLRRYLPERLSGPRAGDAFCAGLLWRKRH